MGAGGGTICSVKMIGSLAIGPHHLHPPIIWRRISTATWRNFSWPRRAGGKVRGQARERRRRESGACDGPVRRGPCGRWSLILRLWAASGGVSGNSYGGKES
jgi:hypothetical protein